MYRVHQNSCKIVIVSIKPQRRPPKVSIMSIVQEIDELCIEWEPEPLHTTLAQPRKDRKDVIITRCRCLPSMLQSASAGFYLLSLKAPKSEKQRLWTRYLGSGTRKPEAWGFVFGEYNLIHMQVD